ncbi:MAG: rhomboid family intramembrane serine protease [Muribaculaceae bacterium]
MPRAFVTWIIAALNVAVFAAAMAGADTLVLGLDSHASPVALLTYMFSHSYPIHFIANILLLIVAGRRLEQAISHISVAIIYICGGIAGGLLFVAACKVIGADNATLTGASAATLALCTALIGSTSNMRRNLLHNRLSMAIIILLILNIVYGLQGHNPGGAIAHLGGIAIGIIATVIINRRHIDIDADAIIDKARQSGYSSLSPDEQHILNQHTLQANGEKK